MNQAIKIGVIGGSGLYQMKDLKIIDQIKVETPFGNPSDDLIIGEINGVRLAFLPRHGLGHRLMPTELNFRANIAAFKILGCQQIISVSAVGSLKEEIIPGHLVMIDQFIDRTKSRIDTFFGEGLVAHVGFAEPTCNRLRSHLHKAAGIVGATSHPTGTYVCMEGPAFSTKAESHWYRSMGADVIGMTNLQEAKLAREAGICYATIALATDYDCWHDGHDSVTVDIIIATLLKNVSTAQELIKSAVTNLDYTDCKCAHSLDHAILTDKSKIPAATLKKLAFLLPEGFGK